MPDKLSFRRATTGDWEDVEITRPGDEVIPRAGEQLTVRAVELADGTLLREHRVASREHRNEGYDRIDNEILASRRLHELAGGGGYPAELACLFGDYDDKATVSDPFTLFEPYRGDPLREVVKRLLPDQRDAVQAPADRAVLAGQRGPRAPFDQPRHRAVEQRAGSAHGLQPGHGLRRVPYAGLGAEELGGQGAAARRDLRHRRPR